MEALGQLAGGIAHDFNNLLNVIVGYTALIQARAGVDETLCGHAEQIMKAADRAAALTRQLLVFSRKQSVETRILDLNDIITNLSKLLPPITGNKIQLVFRSASNLGKVKADAGQLEQVILNLVINARDAMPNGGQLVLETENVEITEASAVQQPGRKLEYVLLKVSDTGEGMSEEVKAHIFEPFFTTKQAGKGTGLGLATTYAIVHQGGGTIDAESEPGRGTTMRVYLPRVREESNVSLRTS
jgi:signal transduction histidine kinase